LVKRYNRLDETYASSEEAFSFEGYKGTFLGQEIRVFRAVVYDFFLSDKPIYGRTGQPEKLCFFLWREAKIRVRIF